MKFVMFSLLFLIVGCSTISETLNASDKNKKRAEIFFRHGTTMVQQGSYSKGLRYLKQATELDPDNEEYMNNLGLAYIARGAKNEAEASFKKTLEINPDFTEAKHNLGAFYLHTNNLTEAEKYLIEATKDLTYEGVNQSLYLLATISIRRKEDKKAEKYLLEATSNNSGFCKGWYALSEIELKNQRFLAAQKYLEKATNGVCFEFPQGHYELGKLYLKNRNYDLARKKFINIIKLFPETNWAKQAKSSLHKYELL